MYLATSIFTWITKLNPDPTHNDKNVLHIDIKSVYVLDDETLCVQNEINTATNQ